MPSIPLSQRLLFALDPERAHGLALAVLQARRTVTAPPALPRLATRVAGLDFANPLGIAAGFDKDGAAIAGMFSLGVGLVEIGTLTPVAQPGNGRPRLFRLTADRAVVNRMGFNNGGVTAALPRADAWRARGLAGRLGINVGANKDAVDRVADYAHGVAAAAPHADFVTINISSPNTPGLRDLQHGTALHELLAAATAARGSVPLFLKVAPDLNRSAIDAIARTAIESGVDALVVGNTTVSRPSLRGTGGEQAGGLSGAPLAPLARRALADFRAATGGTLPLVAAGGIDDAQEAYLRIRSGASLVQIYTALVFAGPGLPRRILRDLDVLLARDGFAHVGEAIGTG